MANEKRLIDCEQAKRATYEEIFWTESEQAVVRNFLAKLPKVDAVEVVRCYFCKHYNRIMGTCMVDRKLGQTTPQIRVKQDDFCSYGERRTDDG